MAADEAAQSSTIKTDAPEGAPNGNAVLMTSSLIPEPSP